MAEGKKNWYIVDGWLPQPDEVKNAGLVGHEALMILNCQPIDAEVFIDIYYEDREPDEGIRVVVPARRVRCLRMDNPEHLSGVVLSRETQYAIRVRSSTDIVVQYGRMDVTQPNLSFIGLIGYAE